MKIHEYQAKELFKKFDIPIPDGHVAFSTDEAKAAAEKLGQFPVVVKAQIHAGGRGKGGGVKLAKSIDEAESLAKEIVGMTLVTHQTGPEG
ncbi:MAG: acetate--CoA ligase family protein, partial [Deltaproteobacteria bacterium]|nr:acetate--CoA ligase family protein [Deltaproteobacteria bacterium]